MKILITNNQLGNLAGTELFTLELAEFLKNQGHEVSVFSFYLGALARKISELGIPVTNNLKAWENQSFDLIHAQHNTTAILARSIFPRVPMIFMSHGTIHELEQPPSLDLGIEKFVAVSERVRENLINKGINPEKIVLIRNAVNLKAFFSQKAPSSVPKNILVISNHYIEKTKTVVEATAKELKMKVKHIGLPENPQEKVATFINWADIVIAIGRSALEAMACERNVIIFDLFGGDGMVDENNFFELRECNFSGRKYRRDYKIKELAEQIKKYDPNRGKKLRRIIEKEHNAEDNLKKFENLYQEIIQRGNPVTSKLQAGELCNEMAFMGKIMAEHHTFNNQLKRIEQKIFRFGGKSIYGAYLKLKNKLKHRDYNILERHEIISCGGFRVLAVVNHFYGKSKGWNGKSTTQNKKIRRRVVEKTLEGLQTIPGIEIVVCGIKGKSLVKIDKDFSYLSDPTLLLYETIDWMTTQIDKYDYFINIEDDILINNETFERIVEFDKNNPLDECFHPNRMEYENGEEYCVDLKAMPGWTNLTKKYGQYNLRVAKNPHSAIAILSQEKLRYAKKHTDLKRRDIVFVHHLESAYSNLHSPFKLFRAYDNINEHKIIHLDNWDPSLNQ